MTDRQKNKIHCPACNVEILRHPGLYATCHELEALKVKLAAAETSLRALENPK